MNRSEGQSVVEILIATATVSVLLVSLLILGTNSLKSTTYSRNLSQATTYANQTAEWARNAKNEYGWETLADIIEAGGTPLVRYCFNSLPDSQTTFENLSPGECTPETYIPQTIFWREIVFDTSNKSGGLISALVTVFWQGSNTTHQSSVSLTLAKWQ